MRTLHENNIECPLPVLNVYGAEKSLEKFGDGIFDASVTINVDFCGISRCAAKTTVVRNTMPSECDAPCGLQDCKNRPAPFPGRPDVVKGD